MYGGFVLSGLTIILSKFVAVEMTSQQNSPFSLELMPAYINIALALPTSVGIFLSTTEFCWGVPGAVNSKITPRFCLSHSFEDFCFLHCCQALFFLSQFHIFWTIPLSTLVSF